MVNNNSSNKRPMKVVLGVVISSLITFSAAAQSNSVWQLDLKSKSATNVSKGKNSSLSLNRLKQQDAVYKLAQREVTSVAWQSNKAQGLSDLGLSFTQDEYSAVMGYRQNGVTFSAMTGSGKEYGRLSNDYSGIDPYTFHGGNSLGFNYYGAALDIDMSRFGHVQFGFADVKSDLLEDRRAQYMEWSNGNYYLRGNHFQRGSHNLGYGLDAGFYVGDVQVAFQSMDLENDKNMRRIRFHYQKNEYRQYWFDVASHSNALYESNDDTRIMFSMRQVLGKKKFSPSYVSADTPKEKKEKKGINRPILIGVGVAAIAAAASSGSDSQDDTPRIELQHNAARERLNIVNPISVRENREYGGYVYRNQDGTFSSTEAVPGEAASVLLPDPRPGFGAVPAGTTTTATYHTHAAFDPRFDNENFSPTDIQSDAELGVDGYLGTPGGQFKYHDVETGRISTLGTVNN